MLIPSVKSVPSVVTFSFFANLRWAIVSSSHPSSPQVCGGDGEDVPRSLQQFPKPLRQPVLAAFLRWVGHDQEPALRPPVQ
jgi:hypothetical protein